MTASGSNWPIRHEHVEAFFRWLVDTSNGFPAKVKQFINWVIGGFDWLLARIVESLTSVRAAVVRLIVLAFAIGFFIVLLPTTCNNRAVAEHQSTADEKKERKPWAETFGTAGIWSLACLGSGLFGGFLFGIPKVLQDDGKNTATRSIYGQLVNNNLVEVSDWLCKIIVGVGLIELRDVPEGVDRLAAALARDLGPGFSHAYAGGLIVYFVAIGFLSGYLLTRLFLATQFRLADLEALGAEKQVEADLMRAIRIEQAISRGKHALDSKDPELIKRAVDPLVEVRGYSPGHRSASIVLGRLYRALNQWKEALDVLNSALDHTPASRANDRADLLYQYACYEVLMAADPNQTKRDELLKDAFEKLRESVSIKRDNAAMAKLDEDFSSVRADDRFKTIVGDGPAPQQQPLAEQGGAATNS
jgi:tetratricopeptide (TPR) repeat protein